MLKHFVMHGLKEIADAITHTTNITICNNIGVILNYEHIAAVSVSIREQQLGVLWAISILCLNWSPL